MPGLVAIVFSLILLTGGFLPWVQDGPMSSRGIYNLEGMYVLVSGLSLLVLLIYSKLKQKVGFGLVYIAIGASCLLIACFDFFDISSKVEILIKGMSDVDPGLAGESRFLAPEFIIILIGSIGLIIAGLYQHKIDKTIDPGQGRVAGFIANRIAFNQQRSFSRFHYPLIYCGHSHQRSRYDHYAGVGQWLPGTGEPESIQFPGAYTYTGKATF